MNLLIIFLSLQSVVIAVIVMTLWHSLRKELWAEALRVLDAKPVVSAVTDVMAIVAGEISSGDEQLLRRSLGRVYPRAVVTIECNKHIRSGLVIKAGDDILDYSLLTRLKYLAGQQDA